MMRGTSRRALVASMFILVFLAVLVNSGESMETKNLIAVDRTGQLTEDQIRDLTTKAEKALGQILRFYATGSRTERFGKIRIEFDQPRKGIYAAVFLWGKEGKQKVRVVRIFGVTEEVQMMTHKLTHAVFPNTDKLIRNMMGIPMEARFGNPATFPMCGFTCDEWVYALRQNRSFIPLEELGPDHQDWGMTTKGDLPVVVDRARQHAAYAESGSFGAFLLETYGVEKVKAMNREGEGKKRPWESVFGASLKELEARWIQEVESRQTTGGKNIPALIKLLGQNPQAACSGAQTLTAEKAKK